MPFQTTFSQRQHYDSLKSGVTVETVLRRGETAINCTAKIDTGSHVCLFEREIGEYLGLNIESGQRLELGTLTGSLTAYGHEITLETLGLTFDTFVYFPQLDNVRRNILGRHGWLQLVRLGIVDYDSELYLSPYSDSP